jgi:cytochrome c oxidase subunit 2
MALGRGVTFAGAWLAVALGARTAGADQPRPWQIGFQEAATPVMERTLAFNDLVFVVVTGIGLLVFALIAYVLTRFNARRNPTPTRTTHNTLLEFVWTVVPIFVVVAIAVPSVRLLYLQDVIPEVDMTIKAIGHQWYWSYEYPDHGGFGFDATMKQEADLAPGEPRLLATDTTVVLPVDTTVRILLTSDDVLHAWTVPAFGVKKDAVPGRTVEMWVRVEREGTYYGQCSELCGVYHGFMPIQVEVVSKERFAAWVAAAQAAFGAPTRALAATEPAPPTD